MDEKEFEEYLKEVSENTNSKLSSTDRAIMEGGSSAATSTQNIIQKTQREEAASLKEKEREIAQKEKDDRGFLDYTAQFVKATAYESGAMALDMFGGLLDVGDWHHHIPFNLGEDSEKLYGGANNFHTKAFDVFRSPIKWLADFSRFVDNTIGDGEYEMGNFISDNAKSLRETKQQYYSDYGNETANYWLNGTTSLIGSIVGNLGPMGLIGKGAKMLGGIKGVNANVVSKMSGALTNIGMTTGIGTTIGVDVYDKSLDYQLDKIPDYKAKKQAFQENFIQQYSAENPKATATEIEAAVKNETLNFTDDYVNKNPEISQSAREYAIKGADVATKTNAAFGFLLNYGMGNLVANSVKKPLTTQSTRAFSETLTKKGVPVVAAKKSIWEKTPMVIAKESVAEGIEEGGTEYFSEKAGTLAGMGEAYGISDVAKQMEVGEMMEQFMWGAAGGGITTSGFKLLDREGRKLDKERLDKAKKNIEELNLIIESANGLNLNETTYLNLSYKEQAKQVRKAKVLEQLGRKEEADKILSKIVDNQALTAFQTGTTEKLVDVYTHIAGDKKQPEHARKNATEALNHIKQLEQIYLREYGSNKLNKGAIYANRASKLTAEKQLKELDLQINKKKTELLTDIATKSGAGKMSSLDVKRVVTEDQGEGKMPIIKELEETLDFDTNDLFEDTSKKYDNEESNKAYNDYKKQVEEFENAKQLKQLEKNRKEAVEYISDLNDEHSVYNSSKYQRQLQEYNDFRAELANKKDEIAEKLQTSTKDEFDNYLDKLFDLNKNTHPYIQKEIDSLKDGYQQLKYDADNTTTSKKQKTIDENAKKFKEKTNPQKEKISDSKKEEEKQKVKQESSEVYNGVNQNDEIKKTNEVKDNNENKPLIIDPSQIISPSQEEAVSEVVDIESTDPDISQIITDENEATQEISEVVEDQKINPGLKGETDGEKLSDLLNKANEQLSDARQKNGEDINDFDREGITLLDPKVLRGDLSSEQIKKLAASLLGYKSRIERDLGRAVTFEEMLDHLIDVSNTDQVKDLFEPFVEVWKNSGLTFTEDPYVIYNRKFESAEVKAENFLAELSIASEDKVDDSINTREKNENKKVSTPDNITETSNDKTMLDVTNENIDCQLSFLSIKNRKVYDEDLDVYNREYVNVENLNSSDTLDNPHAVLSHDAYLPGTELTIEVVPESLHDKIFVVEYDINGDDVWKGTFNDWVQEYGPMDKNSDRYINKVPMIVRDSNGTSIAMVRDTQWIAPFNIKDGTTKRDKIIKAKVKNQNMRKAIWANHTSKNEKTKVVVKDKTAGVWNAANQKANAFKERNGRLPTLREGAGVHKKKNKDGQTVEEVQTHVAYYKKTKNNENKCVFTITNDKGEKEVVELDPEELQNNEFPIRAGNNIIYNYEVRQVRTKIVDGKKVPVYQAFAINVDPKDPTCQVGAKKAQVIFNLFYLNYLHANASSNSKNTHLSIEEQNKFKRLKENYGAQIEKIKNDTGFDIKDSLSKNGFIFLLKQYLPIKDISTKFGNSTGVGMNQAQQFAKTDLSYKDGDFFMYQVGSTLHFGIKKQTGSDESGNLIFTTEQAGFISLKDGSTNTRNAITGLLQHLKNGNLAKVVHNVSHDSVLNSKKTLEESSFTVVDDAINFDFTPSEGTYEEGLYDILQTGVSSYNIGTEENPEHVTLTQPVISYELADKQIEEKTQKNDVEVIAETNNEADNIQAAIDENNQSKKEATTEEEKRELEREAVDLQNQQSELEDKKAGRLTAEDKKNNRKIKEANDNLEAKKEEILNEIENDNLTEEQVIEKENIIKDINKQVDENNNNLVSEKPIQKKQEYTSKEIEDAKKAAIKDTSFLDFDFTLKDAKEVTEETVNKVKQKIFGIEGINSEHIADIVEHLNNKVSEVLLQDEKLTKQELLKLLEEEVNNLIDIRLDSLQQTRDILAIANDEQSNVLIEKIDRALNYMSAIKNNIQPLVQEGYNRAYRELNLTTTKETNDEADNPEVDQNNAVEKNHSKTFLEEGGKSSLTYKLRRFFSQIPKLNKEGDERKGFLNTSKHYSFDEVYNTVQSILANSYPNFDEMIGRLEENVDAMPALQMVIDKLKNADKQIQNQFVSKMTKNNTGMQFISYSTATVTQGLNSFETTSLSIYDTNSANVSRKINNNWFSNFYNSELIYGQDNKVYINPEKAEEILNKYGGKKEEIKQQKNLAVVSLVEAMVAKNIFKSSKVPTIVANKLGKGNNLVRIKKQDYVVKLENGVLTVKKQKAADRNYLNELKAGIITDEGIKNFKEFLAEFGVHLSDKTIADLTKNGLRIDKSRTIPFKDLFLEKGVDSEYIFGSLLSYLKNNIEKDSEGKYTKTEFDKEVNNPLKNSNFLKLAKLESKYNERGIMPTSFRDGKKTIQQYTIPKYMTDRVTELKQPTGKDFQSLQKCSFSENSFYLNLIANDPKVQEHFNVNYVGLNSIKERGKRLFKTTGITSISNADHDLVKLGYFINQKLSSVKTNNYTTKKGFTFKTRMAQLLSPTMSDKSVATIITAPIFDFDYLTLLDENSEIGIDDTVANLLFDQILLPEINRITEFLLNKSEYDISGYNQGATKFLMLPLFNNLQNKDGLSILDVIKDKIEQNPSFDIVSYIQSTFVDENNNSLIDALLKDYVNNEVNKTLDDWNSFGVIRKNKNGVVSELKGIDSKFLKNDNKFGKDTTLEEKSKLLAYDFVINSMIGNANMFMTIAGDPAMYYKSKSSDAVQQSKDTFNNVGKRLANQIAPREKLTDAEDNQYLQIFLEDIEAPANNLLGLAKALNVKGFKQEHIDTLKAAINKGKDGKADIEKLEAKFPQLAPYFQIEGTDAQEYTTWKEHLYVLEKMGETNPELFHDKLTKDDIENLRRIFEDEIPLDNLSEKERNLVNLVLQPMKPVYTGQVFQETTGVNGSPSGVMRTVYIKSSSIPLIPQLTKGFELDTLRKAMEKIEADKGKTVRASYKSANKLGAPTKSTKLFDNSTGNFLSDIDKETTTFEQLASKLEINSLVLDRKNFGIQQKVPFKSAKRKEDTVSHGTQTSKLLLGDGITDIDGFLFDGKEKSGRELKEIFDDNFGKLTALTKANLLNELAIDLTTGISNNPKKTAKALQKILKDEAESRGYSKQVIDSLTYNLIYDANGDVMDYEFTIPLWISAESNRFESLLNSIATNRVAKIKMPGNSYVASSSEGFRQVVTEKGGDASKIIFTSKFDGELKGAEFDADGNLKKTQVFLPSKFRTNDGKMLNMFAKDSEGNYIYVKQEKNGAFMLKEDMFDKELLSNISFRTPTSAHLSMADVEIVGFVPYECGDLIVVPRNLTVQVGLDFDIDKQTNYQYYHEIDENGKVVILKDNIEELEKKIADTKQELQEGNFADLEKDFEDFLAEINEEQKLKSEELRELRKNKNNTEEIINKLWQKEIDLNSEINFLNLEIKNLKENDTALTKEEVASEIQKVKRKRKTLFKEKAKTVRERKELSESKVRSEEVKKLQEEKNEQYKNNSERISEARKEKWNKIKKKKNELRFIISSGEKRLQKLYKNEIVKVHSSVLSNPQVKVQQKITTALSIDDSKQQAEKLNSLQLSKNANIETFNPLSSRYQKSVMEAGAAGKVGIGAYSNDVVFHSMVKQNTTEDNKIQLAEPIRFGNLVSDGTLGNDFVLQQDKKQAYLEIIQDLDNLEVNNARKLLESVNETDVELGIMFIEQTLFDEFSDAKQELINNVKNPRRITDVLTERQNIATDNAKELIMQTAGLNDETLDVDKVLILLGFDKDASGNSIPFFFLNQPIIKEFINEYKNLDSVISDFTPNKEQFVYDRLKTKYSFEEDPKKLSALKNSMDSMMTGEKFEKQIQAYHTNDKQISEEDFRFQQAVLEKFLELRALGKILRETQQNFNADSQGIGKSTFDLYTRIDRLKMLMDSEEIKNIDSLIGEFSEEPREGFIRLDENFYVKPTTSIGHITVNTLSTGLAITEKHMPYNNYVFNRIFNEIINVKGGSMSPYAQLELKQNVLKEMKKYINSMNFDYYTFDSSLERKTLFIDGENENEKSLASYLQKSLLDPTQTNFEFLNSIPLFKQISFNISKDGSPSKLEFNNTIDNIDENSLYSSIFKLMERKVPLPDFNGKEYNSRMLAQDLINYALLEGGVQEATQIAKFIPASFLENTKYNSVVNEVNKALFENRGLNSIFAKPINGSVSEDSPYNISAFTMQYIQHNPTTATLVDLKENAAVTNVIKKGEEGKEEIVQFSYKSEKETPAFMRVYNSNANKNTDLYYTKDGITYYKIDTLGTNGMNEYNAEQGGIVQDSILPKKSNISYSNRFLEESQDDVYDKSKIKNNKENYDDLSVQKPFSLDKGDIALTLQQIAASEDISPSLKFMAETLLPILDREQNQVALTVMSLENANGEYDSRNNRIIIDESYANSNNRNAIAETILHEYFHRITVGEILKYYDVSGKQPDIKIDAKPGVKIPVHVTNLVSLYNEFVKQANTGVIVNTDGSKTPVPSLNQIKDKIRQRGDLDKKSNEKILYPGIDIFEFIAGCATRKDFQELLHNMKYKGTDKSMFDRFKEILSKLVNKLNSSLGLEQVGQSNLTEALDNIFEIIDLPSAKKDKLITKEDIDIQEHNKKVDEALRKVETTKKVTEEVVQEDPDNKKLEFTYSPDPDREPVTIKTQFPLGDQQEKALKNMINWAINGDETAYTLEGFAGTGKTSIIALTELFLKEYQNGVSFVYSAPTHSATVSLGLNTSKYGNSELPATVKSSIYVDKRRKPPVAMFTKKLKDRFLGYRNFLVVDEASFLNDQEVKQVVQAANNSQIKVIFLGDPKQLPAVDTSGRSTKPYSSAFDLFSKSTLDKVYRTGEQKLLNILTKIRNNIQLSLYKSNDTDNLKFLGLSKYNNELEKDIRENPEDVAILAYSNNEVITANKKVRMMLGLKGAPKVGEKIIGYIGSGNKQVERGNLANSVPYIITSIEKEGSFFKINAESSKLKEIAEAGVSVPTNTSFRYLPLSNNDTFNYEMSPEEYANNNKEIADIFAPLVYHYARFQREKSYYPRFLEEAMNVKSKLNSINLGNNYIYNPRSGAMELYNYGNPEHRSLPKQFQLEKGVDFGYAMTIHKSQGMTIPKVYFDPATLNKVGNVEIVNDKGEAVNTEKNALYYVAMSRSSKKLVVLDNGNLQSIEEETTIEQPLAEELNTDKEKFAQEQGFEGWKHVVRSINKRAREKGKPQRPVSIEEFNKLSKDQIESFAKVSKSAKEGKPTQPQATNLGTKTAPVGGNVVINATKGKSPQPGAVVAFRTKGKTEQNMIDALADNAVGNPFGPYAAIKTGTDGEAVTRFLNWLEGTGDTNVMQNYRNALLAKAPKLKGKTIYYYKDLGRPSHATALDYFLNKPTTQAVTKPKRKDNPVQISARFPKDQLKADYADGIIGYGVGSTGKYAEAFGGTRTTFSPGETIMISVNGKGRPNQAENVEKTKQAIDKAIASGVSFFIADNRLTANSDFNKSGEGVIRDYLLSKGLEYETFMGVGLYKIPAVNQKELNETGYTQFLDKSGEVIEIAIDISKPKVETKPIAGLPFVPVKGDLPKISDLDITNDGDNIGDIINLKDVSETDIVKKLERDFKLRNLDGSRKRFVKRDYNKVLEKTKLLNINNKNTSFNFRIVEVMGEKGDRRTYYAIAIIPRNNINFDNSTELDNLINDFEQTCK